MALATKVRGEEISALYRQAGAVLWANLAVGAIMAGSLWGSGGRIEVAAWFGAVAVLTLARFALQRSYRRASTPDLELWGRRFVLASTGSGMLWGAAGALFFESGSAETQAIVTFAIAGMTAAAAGTLACHLRAFFGYFVCALAPLTLRTLSEGDSAHFGVGLMLIAYAVGMQYVARNNHRAFTRAFQLALENAELVEKLSRSSSELQERVEERTAQLEQQAEVLRRAQRLELVGKLAGSLAHDFNNLLTVVLSNTALLKEKRSQDDELGRAALDETLQAARRGAGLIRQLLSFSHRQRTEPRVFSMIQLVSDSQGLIKRLAGDGITISLELGSEPSFVHADPAQMEQVLINLVSAASAAMPNGGALHVRTRVEQTGECDSRVLLYVEDSSDGTPPRSLDGTFDPFPASASEALEQRLGLAAARAIIEQSGGSFEVSAAAQKGTRFCVSLPASRHSPRPTPILGLAPSAPSATILVVDDEVSLRSVIRRTLARDGYKVLVAEDGERALALSRSHPTDIDLLVTDVVMPGLSGPELATRLLSERPGLGVLFISGYSFEEPIPVTDASVGTSYLAKPFDSSTLSARVRQLLEAIEQRTNERATT